MNPIENIRSIDIRDRPQAPAPPRVAYVMTIFPTVSETFTLHEMLMVEEEGVDVVPVSLQRPRDDVTHEAARKVAARTLYLTSDPLRL